MRSDDSLVQEFIGKRDEKLLNSRCILKVEPAKFVDRSFVGKETKRIE